MAWLVLVSSALFEIVWASLLPATKGFSRLLPSLGFLAALAVSMSGLAYAARTLPIGTAYAVWVGIGAIGTVIVGIVVHNDAVTVARIGFLVMLLVAIVGLRVVTPAV